MIRGNKKHPCYPFDSGYTKVAGKIYPLMTTDAADRCRRVAEFDLNKCRAALKNKNLALQKTVRQAIERRIRKLEKQ